MRIPFLRRNFAQSRWATGLVGRFMASLLIAGLSAPSYAWRLETDEAVVEPLSPGLRPAIESLIKKNLFLLGARPEEFCGIDRANCSALYAEPGPTRVRSASLLSVRRSPVLGREWPVLPRPSDASILRIRVAFDRGGGLATREIEIASFSLDRGGERVKCLFPVAHWDWSGLLLGERFASAPLGVCGSQTLTVAGFLVAFRGDHAPPWAIRFLSREEAEAWASGSVDALRWPGKWQPSRPFAKYFFLDSLRWWRGGGSEPDARYAYAVRFPKLPLEDLVGLSRAGDAFLDLYEDGEQVELTIVTRHGLATALSWPHELLVDTSGPDDRVPALGPAPGK